MRRHLIYLLLGATISLSGCAKRTPEELEAWVKYKNPNAALIKSVGRGWEKTHVFCKDNKLIVVSTTTPYDNNSYDEAITDRKEIVLSDSLTCEELQRLNPAEEAK